MSALLDAGLAVLQDSVVLGQAAGSVIERWSLRPKLKPPQACHLALKPETLNPISQSQQTNKALAFAVHKALSAALSKP